MKTNKSKWQDRHEKGMSKLDVAIETQMSADSAEITEMVEKANSKKRLVNVDAAAEAKAEGERKAAANEAALQKKIADDEASALKQAEAEAENEAKKARDAEANKNANK